VRTLVGKQNVLSDGEGMHQLEMLMHHADAAAACFGRSAQRYRFIVDKNAAGFWCIEAGGDVHQRRFACSILAEESVNLSGIALEFRVIKNYDTVKGFPYSLKRKCRSHQRNYCSYF
jgi:hypothetical protein